MKCKSKRIMLCLMGILILFSCCVYKIKILAGENDEPVINNATPKIRLESPSVVRLKAGDEKDMDLTIRNTGAAMAYNILVQTVIDTDTPFTVYFLNDSNSIPVISGTGRKVISLHIKVDKNAKAGSYNINLKHSFTNETNTNYNESDSFSVKIDNPVPEPIIILSDFVNTNSKIIPGGQFSLSAIIKNLSSQNANELQVSLEGLKIDEISLANSMTGTYYPHFQAGMQKYLSFDFIASTKIKSGSYPINFKVNYKDDSGKSYDKDFMYYVKVDSENKNDKPVLELLDMISPVKNFSVDEKADIYLTLKNSGPVDIKNIKVTAATDSDGAIVPRTSNINLISLLEPGNAKDLLFCFSPTSKAKTQNYVIKFLVEYENGSYSDDNKPEIDSFEQYASINVYNPDIDDTDQPQSKPKIIVSNYSTDPIIVTAGSEFDLSLGFKNTHKVRRIENAKVSLTIDEATTSTNEQKGNVFTPVNGSTNFFIGDINPGEVINKKLRLYTVPTATPKNYSVTVDFEYEDDKHNEIKSSEKIGINVKQATKLDTSEINIPTDAYVNQPTVISFDFYNTGKVNLNNLLIKIAGDNFDARQSAIYYGKFNTSTNETYEGNFIPLEAGEKQGQIIISYEDDTGETKTLIKDFVINVQDMPSEPHDFNQDAKHNNLESKNKKSMSKKYFIWGGAGIVGVLAIIIVIVKKIRSKKKDMDIDE